MQGNTVRDYKFKFIYKFIDIINDGVENDFDFWNFNSEAFVQSALKFNNKNSLLHIYVSSTLYCYYLTKDQKIRGRFFDPFLIKGLKYPVRNKSH